ncbi:MAG: helix-turn-helix domain-containing protein [Gammaproteobacteria bacterium]|nr:helix-turn-helix domain-containing protein [Gammaproteobacteria bacterium]
MSETTATTGADVVSSENLISPGATIRRTRERAGLSLEDLAAQMKLAKNTLDALERDDFDQLKEPVYVRGYYRKCAKVLPVSEQELIAAYEARVKPKAPPTPNRIILAGGVSSGVRKSRLKPGIAVAVVVAVAIGFLAWNADRGAPVVAPTVEPALEAEPAEDLAPETDAEPLPSMPAASAPAATAKPVAPVAAPAAPAPAAKTPAAAAPTPAIQSPGSSAAPKAAGVPATQLVVGFEQPSWVRVEDSRNRTLVIGLVRAGERQVLDGEPPYTVFLGNAAQARVEYAGQPIDITRYIRENGTARFTVP